MYDIVTTKLAKELYKDPPNALKTMLKRKEPNYKLCIHQANCKTNRNLAMATPLNVTSNYTVEAKESLSVTGNRPLPL